LGGKKRKRGKRKDLIRENPVTLPPFPRKAFNKAEKIARHGYNRMREGERKGKKKKK